MEPEVAFEVENVRDLAVVATCLAVIYIVPRIGMRILRKRHDRSNVVSFEEYKANKNEHARIAPRDDDIVL